MLLDAVAVPLSAGASVGGGRDETRLSAWAR